jgi:hypothetical protein
MTDFVATELLDIAITSDNVAWIVEAGAVRRFEKSQDTKLHLELSKPTTATARGDETYLLSEDGRRLYRLDANEAVDDLDLTDVGVGDAFIRHFGQRGMRIDSERRLLLAFGNMLVRVELRNAQWTRIRGPHFP